MCEILVLVSLELTHTYVHTCIKAHLRLYSGAIKAHLRLYWHESARVCLESPLLKPSYTLKRMHVCLYRCVCVCVCVCVRERERERERESHN
jgi:hypothetical protein